MNTKGISFFYYCEDCKRERIEREAAEKLAAEQRRTDYENAQQNKAIAAATAAGYKITHPQRRDYIKGYLDALKVKV